MRMLSDCSSVEGATIVMSDWRELTKDELYAILRLRQEVFVLEQYCPFVDADDLDQKAIHMAVWDGEDLVGYSRILPAGAPYEESSFGRLIVAKSFRSTGLGTELVERSLKIIEEYFGPGDIRIMAQHYLIPFYGRFGFRALKGRVWEDDILHFYMIKEDESRVRHAAD